MKDSFSSNITPKFLLWMYNLFGEIEILINSVLFILRRRLFLNNQTLMLSAHRERVHY